MYHVRCVCGSPDYRSHLSSSRSEVQLSVHPERDSGAMVCPTLRPRHIQVSAIKKQMPSLIHLFKILMFHFWIAENLSVCNILFPLSLFFFSSTIFDHLRVCVCVMSAGWRGRPWGSFTLRPSPPFRAKLCSVRPRRLFSPRLALWVSSPTTNAISAQK